MNTFAFAGRESIYPPRIQRQDVKDALSNPLCSRIVVLPIKMSIPATSDIVLISSSSNKSLAKSLVEKSIAGETLDKIDVIVATFTRGLFFNSVKLSGAIDVL
jgi:hypothetical protein